MFHSTAPASATVVIVVWILSKDFIPEWDRKPLGDPMATDVANLLGLEHGWQCKCQIYPYNSGVHSMLGKVPGMYNGSGTLYMSCDIKNAVVSLSCIQVDRLLTMGSRL